MMESGSYRHAAAALVLMEGLLTKWLHTFPPANGAVEAALTFATESIDNFDSAMAKMSATEGRPSIPLRELVKLEPNTPHAA
jgi:hypothetical protein